MQQGTTRDTNPVLQPKVQVHGFRGSVGSVMAFGFGKKQGTTCRPRDLSPTITAVGNLGEPTNPEKSLCPRVLLASSRLQTRNIIRSHACARQTCQEWKENKNGHICPNWFCKHLFNRISTRSTGLSIRHSIAQKRFENHLSSKDFTVSPLLKHHLMERAHMRINENKHEQTD